MVGNIQKIEEVLMAAVRCTSSLGEREVFIVIRRGHGLKTVMKHYISFCSCSNFL